MCGTLGNTAQDEGIHSQPTHSPHRPVKHSSLGWPPWRPRVRYKSRAVCADLRGSYALTLVVTLVSHNQKVKLKLGLQAAWLSAEGVRNSCPGILSRDGKRLFHTEYHHPAMERTKAPTYAQHDLEDTVLSERSQPQKTLYISCIYMNYPDRQIHGDGQQTRSCWGGEMGNDAHGTGAGACGKHTTFMTSKFKR